jgi:hypothetical protein
MLIVVAAELTLRWCRSLPIAHQKLWSLSGILTMQSGMPWSPIDATSNDLLGTGEFNAQPNIGGAYQAWNYGGPWSAFTSGPTGIPLLDAE